MVEMTTYTVLSHLPESCQTPAARQQKLLEAWLKTDLLALQIPLLLLHKEYLQPLLSSRLQDQRPWVASCLHFGQNFSEDNGTSWTP